MNILEKASHRAVNAMKTKSKDMDEEKCEVVNYGLYVLISDIVKNTILLCISLMLGIFVYSIAAMVSVAVLRTFFGGVHSKSWLGCLITNISLVLSNVYLSLFLSNSNTFYTSILIYAACFLTVLLYVPADHENKPVESKKQKRLLRFLSLILLFVHFIVSVFILSKPFSIIMAISALIASVSTLPIVYKLTANRHGDAYHLSPTNK